MNIVTFEFRNDDPIDLTATTSQSTLAPGYDECRAWILLSFLSLPEVEKYVLKLEILLDNSKLSSCYHDF